MIDKAIAGAVERIVALTRCDEVTVLLLLTYHLLRRRDARVDLVEKFLHVLSMLVVVGGACKRVNRVVGRKVFG